MNSLIIRVLGLVGLASLALAACNRGPSVERDALDLKTRVEGLRDSLSQLDSTELESALIVYRLHLETLAPYSRDSSKRSFVVADGTTLDRSAKNIFKFQAQKRIWMGALQAGSARLTSLANDVQTEYLDTTQARIYLRDEQAALGAVVHEARSRMHAARWCLDKKDSIDRRMDSLFTRWSSKRP